MSKFINWLQDRDPEFIEEGNLFGTKKQYRNERKKKGKNVKSRRGPRRDQVQKAGLNNQYSRQKGVEYDVDALEN